MEDKSLNLLIIVGIIMDILLIYLFFKLHL